MELQISWKLKKAMNPLSREMNIGICKRISAKFQGVSKRFLVLRLRTLSNTGLSHRDILWLKENKLKDFLISSLFLI